MSASFRTHLPIISRKIWKTHGKRKRVRRCHGMLVTESQMYSWFVTSQVMFATQRFVKLDVIEEIRWFWFKTSIFLQRDFVEKNSNVIPNAFSLIIQNTFQKPNTVPEIGHKSKTSSSILKSELDILLEKLKKTVMIQNLVFLKVPKLTFQTFLALTICSLYSTKRKETMWGFWWRRDYTSIAYNMHCFLC